MLISIHPRVAVSLAITQADEAQRRGNPAKAWANADAVVTARVVVEAQHPAERTHTLERVATFHVARVDVPGTQTVRVRPRHGVRRPTA